jgi:TetR/AcrR family transcriptional regulator
MTAERQPPKESGVRDAILDATESIMVEEGYAAVTSRRVAERAGLKSKLVHYYFRTMEDLFVAVYERS